MGKSTVNIEFGIIGKEGKTLENVKDVFRWGFPRDRQFLYLK